VSDPKRLIESAEDEGLERALLASGTRAGPTDEQHRAIWAALAPRLTAAPGTGPARASVAAKSPHAGAAVLKGVSLLALLGAMAVVATRVAGRPQTGATPPAAVAHPPGTAEGMAPAGAGPAEPASTIAALSPSAPGTPESIGRKPASPAHPESRSAVETDPLPLETKVLLAARDALRAGDCSGAVARLNEARARFQGGALPQEREVLAIEALDCAGRSAEAAQRAAEFLRSYPASPHGDLVRRFLR
jgi:hypothetical protein